MRLMVLHHSKLLMEIDMAGDKSRKDIIIKKAIREIAIDRKRLRRRVTNYQILNYMLDNNLGTRWVTILSIRKIRETLPKIYRLEQE